MGIMGWIFYLIIGLIYFFILKYLESKYLITRIEKYIFSIILMLIISGFCFRYAVPYTSDIFLGFLFLMIIDLIYHIYFLEKDFFDKNLGNIRYYIWLIIVGFIINQQFINDVDRVFLTGEDLRILLWFFSIIFIYKFISTRQIFTNYSVSNNTIMSKESILVSYIKLKSKYYDECNYDDKEMSHMIYAIMIYENHRRSKFFRNIDYILFRLNGVSKKLGIMQVTSKKYITDSESIEIVYKKLVKLKEDKKGKKKSSLDVLKDYCKKDYDDVKYIYEIIEKF